MKAATQETNNKMFFNLDNGDPHIVEQLNERSLDSPSLGVLGQYMTLSDTGKYSSSDKKTDYTAAAKNISAPAFFSAGKKDNFVNPDDVQFLIANVSSGIKDSKIYGRAEGFSVDYGHNDSFISPAAGEEIYPLVLEWVSKAEGTSPGPEIQKAGKVPGDSGKSAW